MPPFREHAKAMIPLQPEMSHLDPGPRAADEAFRLEA
jgi:hypothetical protein